MRHVQVDAEDGVTAMVRMRGPMTPEIADAFAAVANAAIEKTARDDLYYVLRWLRQSGAPENIVRLQERGIAFALGPERCETCGVEGGHNEACPDD